MPRAKRGRVIIVCPDTHVPYHDPLAWKTFLAAVKFVKPDDFIFIGDFADFYAVSFFAKNPNRERFLKREVTAVCKELDKVSALQRAGYIKRVAFHSGNHEFRLERYLNEKAPELYGLIDVQSLFELKERGWRYVPYGESISIGKIDITHDIGICGKNAAQKSVELYGDNIVIGHTHQLAAAYSGTVRGDKYVGLNVGWLGNVKHVDYRHRAIARKSYQLGFGLIHQDNDGFSSCHPIPIHRGKCEVNGMWIDGRAA